MTNHRCHTVRLASAITSSRPVGSPGIPGAREHKRVYRTPPRCENHAELALANRLSHVIQEYPDAQTTQLEAIAKCLRISST